MSLWAATVITNLLSSIPVFGQDLVELNNITEFSTCYFNEAFIFSAKGVARETLLSVLPTVGTVSPHALKKGKKVITGEEAKREYLSIPYQFIAFLTGFIDGDGYIQITRTTKGFIAIKLVITLSLEDLSTLEYIHSVLKIGKINIYKDLKSPTCKLIINKTDLQEVLFPLFIYHKIFFLTNTRMAQFNLAMHIMKNDIKLYNQIPSLSNIPIVFEVPKNPLDYTLLHFFKN